MEYTHLSNVVLTAKEKIRYDTNVKQLLADKNILSRILKETISEFHDFTLEQIHNCIEGKPEISRKSVYPGEIIEGQPTEDAVIDEGKIAYDIKFYVIVPGENGDQKILIDVEAQLDNKPGYDLTTRGTFYACRMISSQYGHEFTKSHYDDIKKVYSIWICVDVPLKAANTITEYLPFQKDLYGEYSGKARFDLFSVVFVRVNSEVSEEGSELHQLLGVLLSKEIKPQEKLKLLESRFDILATNGLKRRIESMCNLSEAIEAKKFEEDIQKLIITLKRLGLEKKRAIEEIQISYPDINAGAYVEKYY